MLGDLAPFVARARLLGRLARAAGRRAPRVVGLAGLLATTRRSSTPLRATRGCTSSSTRASSSAASRSSRRSCIRGRSRSGSRWSCTSSSRARRSGSAPLGRLAALRPLRALVDRRADRPAGRGRGDDGRGDAPRPRPVRLAPARRLSRGRARRYAAGGTGVPLRARLRSHPQNLIRFVPAKGDAWRARPSWGIEPVPDRLRSLGLLDTPLLWASLGAQPARPRRGRRARAGAVAEGRRCSRSSSAALAGNAMLGLAALIGADGARAGDGAACARRSAATARTLATALNVLQNLGWTIFELIVIAAAAVGALRAGVRLPGGMALEARRRRGDRRRSRCSGRSASCAGG